MPPLCKPQNGLHSGLEISHRTRDSHISTADSHEEDCEQRKEDWTATTNSGTLSARSDKGTPGGKVLKSRGPYLLKTHNVSVARRCASSAIAESHHSLGGGATDLLRELGYQDGVLETMFVRTWWRFRMERGR